MAIPVAREEVEAVLRPLLGTRLLSSCPLADDLTAFLCTYAPYRQTLEAFRDELESLMARLLERYTGGTMMVVTDQHRPVSLGKNQLWRLADEVMGVLFDNLTPFSANFVKLNDYCLHVQSLSALRVLITRYASFYQKEELQFMVQMVRDVYPPARYQSWLPEDL